MFKKLGKSIFIYGIASSLGKFVGLFFVPIYTRIFSTEEYGIIDLISVTISFVCILGILQLESAISRYYYSSKDEKERNKRISTAYWTVLIASSVLSIILIILSGFISNFLFDTSKYAKIISVASLTLPLMNIFTIYSLIIRFLQKPVQYTFIIAAQLLVTVVISILLVVYLDKGIIGVFWGQISGLVTGVLFGTIYLRDKIRFIWNWNYLKEMSRYSLPMVPAVVAGWVNINASRFIILQYLSLSDIGIYSLAVKIASLLSLVESAFVMAWGPFMWEIFEKSDHKIIYKKVMKLVTLGTFIIVSLLAIWSKDVVLLLSTPEYIASASLIGLIGFSLGLRITNQTTMLGAGISKRTEYNTLATIIGISANIAALFVLVPTLGLLGVVISLLVGSTVTTGIGWHFSEKLYYIGFSKTYYVIAYIVTLLVVVISIYNQEFIIYKIIISLILMIVAFYWTIKLFDNQKYIKA